MATMVIAYIHSSSYTPSAQITATPASIRLSTATQPLSGPTQPTEPATRTPTAIGLVILEAITEANVRAEPDPESERLGTIRSGEIYPVLGRYFRWIQFQYNSSPTGRGWVFDELVTITGDESTIPDLTEQSVATADPSIIAATQTLEAITQTPGGILTATAIMAILATSGPNNLEPRDSERPSNLTVLPTFTYPPSVATNISDVGALTERPTLNPEELAAGIVEGVPPIVPIAVLGGLGLFGLLISTIRR